MLNELYRSKYDGSIVQAYCRFTRYSEQTVHGEELGFLRLEDASDINSRIIATDDLDLIRTMTRPGLVEVMLRARPGGLHVYASLLSIQEVSVDEIHNGAALLPRDRCSQDAQTAFDTLLAFNESIPNPILKFFLSRVLLDPAIGAPLMTAKASHGYHHAGSGGLLMHSTDLLKEAGDLAAKAFPDSPDAVTITQLGYLLHDIGKVVTHALGAPHSDLRHEFVTIQLLGTHLAWLNRRYPEAANALQLILDHCTMPARHRGIGKFLGADIVIWCDQLSTARDHGSAWGQKLSRRAANDAGTSSHAVLRSAAHG